MVAEKLDTSKCDETTFGRDFTPRNTVAEVDAEDKVGFVGSVGDGSDKVLADAVGDGVGFVGRRGMSICG